MSRRSREISRSCDARAAVAAIGMDVTLEEIRLLIAQFADRGPNNIATFTRKDLEEVAQSILTNALPRRTVIGIVDGLPAIRCGRNLYKYDLRAFLRVVRHCDPEIRLPASNAAVMGLLMEEGLSADICIDDGDPDPEPESAFIEAARRIDLLTADRDRLRRLLENERKVKRLWRAKAETATGELDAIEQARLDARWRGARYMLPRGEYELCIRYDCGYAAARTMCLILPEFLSDENGYVMDKNVVLRVEDLMDAVIRVRDIHAQREELNRVAAEPSSMTVALVWRIQTVAADATHSELVKGKKAMVMLYRVLTHTGFRHYAFADLCPVMLGSWGEAFLIMAKQLRSVGGMHWADSFGAACALPAWVRDLNVTFFITDQGSEMIACGEKIEQEAAGPDAEDADAQEASDDEAEAEGGADGLEGGPRRRKMHKATTAQPWRCRRRWRRFRPRTAAIRDWCKKHQCHLIAKKAHLRVTS